MLHFTGLCSDARLQIANLLLWKQRNPTASSSLAGLIIENAFDPVRGTYLPVFEQPKLVRHLPTFSEKIATAPDRSLLASYPYFGNGLAIPALYGTPLFEDRQALMPSRMPSRRSTNVGFAVV